MRDYSIFKQMLRGEGSAASSAESTYNKIKAVSKGAASATGATMGDPTKTLGLTRNVGDYNNTTANMANSFKNAIDVINESSYKGELSVHDDKIEKLENEIYILSKSTNPLDQATLQRKQRELEEAANNPERQEILRSIEEQREDVKDTPVNFEYEAESQAKEQEEDSNVLDYITYELPKELGGSASELGWQFGTMAADALTDAGKRRIKNMILKRAAVAGAGAMVSGPIIPLITATLTTAEIVGAGLSLHAMRDSESQAEKADAFEQRFGNMRAEYEHKYGPIDESTPEGHFKLNEIKQAARKGLEQVYKQNMALGLQDVGDVLGLLVPTKALKLLGNTGKAIRSTGAGRFATVAPSMYLSTKMEGIEEGTQTGIVAQYIAGKYKDNPSALDIGREAIDLFSDNAKASFFGKNSEEYQETAEYRNAVRSGEILGGLFGGSSGTSKIASDLFSYKRALKDINAQKDDFVKDEKAVYRANLYTKYFGSDKEEFLFNALTNIATKGSTEKIRTSAAIELAEAKKAAKLYGDLKDAHSNYLADEHINEVFHNAQLSTTQIEDNDRLKNKLDLKYTEELGELSKRITDPLTLQALQKKIELEAARNNLDIYYDIDDKPSNIQEYQDILEKRYAAALKDYKEFTNSNNISDKEISKQLDSTKTIIKNRQNSLNTELVQSDMRGRVNNLYTKEGALDYINNITQPKKETKPFNIKDATTKEYIDYEKAKESKARLKYRQNKVERELYDKDLDYRLRNESIEDVLEDININNPNLTKEGAAKINKVIDKKQEEVDKDAAEIQTLEEKEDTARWDEDVEFTEQDEIRLAELKSKDNVRFERAKEEYNTKAKSYLEDIPHATDNTIKRRIKETFLKGAEGVISHFEKNTEYAKKNEVEDELAKLRNLKKIYGERDEELRTSEEFAGLEDIINSRIARLEEIEKEVEKRLADRDARDRRIPGNQSKLVLSQLGLKPDGTVIEGKEKVNEAIIDIIGKDVYDSIIQNAKGNLTRIHGDIIIQLIKDSSKDKTFLEKSIKEAKNIAFNEMFDIPRIKAVMPARNPDGTAATHAHAETINNYRKNPSLVFSEIIKNIRDTEGANPYDNSKESSIYKYLKDLDLIEFITNAEEPREGSSLTNTELLEIIERHNAHNALFELEKNLNSNSNIHVELAKELNQEKVFAKEPEVRIPTPSNQQTVSIRQLITFLKTPFKGTDRFDGFAYMKGFAGTGKTNVVMAWVYRLSGLNKSSIYVAGHNKDSGETIAKALGKTTKNDIEQAITDIPTLSEDVKLIILDEAPGASFNSLNRFADAIALANKSRSQENKIRVIMLGDPNQVTANGNFSSIDAGTINGTERITQISPLTIRYRSNVAPIVDFQDLFIDQPLDLTKEPIHVKSNVENPSSVSSSNVDLLGVNGAIKDFDTETMAILNARKDRDDGRTRAIIVNNDAEVAKYEKMLADNGIDNVQVYTFVNAQGKTIDEVYQNVKHDNTFNSVRAYNTAVYTASSRATKYLFVGSLPIDNNVSENIEEIAADREEQNKKRSEKFIKEREDELDIVEKYMDEVATDDEIGDEVDEEESEEYEEEEAEIVAEKEDVKEEAPVVDEEGEPMEEDVPEPGEPFGESYEDSFIEPEEKVITTTQDEKSDLEGNTQAREDFTNVSEASHPIDHPTTNTIAPVYSDGSIGKGVTAGDRVLYVLRRTTTGKQVVMIVPVGGNDYAEIGVLSSNELLNPPPGFEEAYGKLLSAVNDPDAQFENFANEKNKVFTIDDLEYLLEAKVEHAQKLAYVYNRNPIGLVVDSLVTRFLSGFFGPGELNKHKGVTKSIRVFTNKEIEKYTSGKDEIQLPFTPLAGIPYLMIGNLKQSGTKGGQGKVQLIRLSPAKLNYKTHGKYVTPILDFIKKIKETHNLLDTIEGGDKIRYGSKKFAQIVKAKSQYRIKLLQQHGVNIAQYKANEKAFKKLFGQLDNIVYDHREETIKDSERKKILANYTVEFDPSEGEEQYKFENRALVKNVKKGIAKLSNGMEVPTGSLIRVPVVKRYDGDAQKALHSISLSNPKIEGKEVRSYVTETTYNKAGEPIGKKVVKKTIALLAERDGSIDIEDLEKMFAFDPVTGESTVNSGFGIRVPISRKDFPPKGEPDSVIKVEDYLLDTFEEVVQTSVTVSLDKSARNKKGSGAVTGTTTEKTETQEEKEDREREEANQRVLEREAHDAMFAEEYELGKDVIEEGQLGTKIVNDSVFGLVKRLLPNITTEEVKIVSDAQMLAITKGREAWGYFKQGVIYLLEGAEGIGQKVIMHEAFHKIFAENLTEAQRNKLRAVVRRENPELRTVSNEKIEEYLAEKFQDWKSKRGRISLALVNFFKKLLDLLGLYETNFANIESVMSDIDNGILGTKKGEVKYEGRAMLKIREDYISTNHFRKAKFEVTTTLSHLVNGSSTTLDGITKNKLNKNHSNLRQALPMEFDEALKELDKIIKSRKKDFEIVLQDPKLSAARLKNNTFNNEVYGILSNPKIRKELINSIYPSVYTGKTEFGETTEDVIDNIYNKDQKGISDDAMDADMINAEKSIGPLVKDMLATIMYLEAGKLKIVNPRFAFVKLLQAFDNVDTMNFENMRSQIKYQLAAEGNPSVEAIYKKIENLTFDATKTNYRDINNERKPLSKDMEFTYQNNKLKFVYNNGKSVIHKRGNSTVDFVRGVYSKLQEQGVDISMEELKAYYDKMKARTTLAAIRTSVGSLRKKNMMVGVRVFENVQRNSEGKIEKDEKGRPIIHYATHYRYNSIRDKGTSQTVRNNIENALIRNHNNLTQEFYDRLKKVKTDSGRIDLIKEFLESQHIPFKGSIPQELLAKTFNDVKGYVESAINVGSKISIETVVEESSERIKNLTSIITTNNETLKAVSYIAADGTKRYEWLASSYGVDVIRYLAGTAARKEENIKNFPFLSAAIFKGNPILNTKDDKIRIKIHRYVDHDGIKDKDGKYPSVSYSDEKHNDWFSRTFNLGFVSMLENRAEDTEGNRRYTQFTYTNSNKPSAFGSELDLKTDAEVKLLIEAALEQQRNRPDFDIDGYNKDKNFLPGNTVEEVYAHLEKVAEELTQQLIDNKFSPDYKIGQTQASLVKFLSDKFVDNGKIKEGFGTQGITKTSKKDYTVKKEQILPIMDLFVKNYYMNGYFMNQIIMGDQAFFKTTADEIKRMSIGLSMGSTGLVNEAAGFMDEKFNVAVSDDIESSVGEQFSRFKKFYGILFERTDGAAFMTPERYENLIRGFSHEMNLAYTQKPVYYGVDKDGIPRGIKYSIIVLSDELCAAHEDLALLREQMRNTKGANGKPIGEYIFKSGFKVGAPNKRTMHNKQGKRGWGTPTGEVDEDNFPIYKDWKEGINPDSIVELDNRNWRIQLNPSHDVKGTISHPTQLTYFSNFNGNNKTLAGKLYDINSLLIERGIHEVDKTLGENGGDPNKIRTKSSADLGVNDARIYEFLTAKDKDGKHMIGINFPVVVNKAVTQVGAYISKATVKIKYPGSKLVLQPDYGTSFVDDSGKRRPLKFREEYTNQKGEKREYMEVILPNMYKDQFRKGDFLFESYMGFRIPSTEMHSAVPLKVVGFYDSKGSNIVIAPGEICAAHGSDYDIDALFVMRREAYEKDDVENLLFKGQIIGYNKKGEKIENYYLKLQKRIAKVRREIEATKNVTKKKQLRILHKQLDGAFDAALKNEVLDTFLDIITHPDNADTMMTPISMARLNGKENSVKAEFKRLGVKVDNNFDLNDPRDQAQIHNDNFSGGIITGTLADNVRGLAYGLQSFSSVKMSWTERMQRLMAIPEVKEEFATYIEDKEGETAKEFNQKIRTRIEELEKEHGLEAASSAPTVFEKNVITIDDVQYDKLGREEIHNEKDTKAGKHLDKDGKPYKISETLDALINAALDNVKAQVLSIINLTNNTSEAFIGMIAMQIPLNTVSKYMITPLIKELSKARNYKEGVKETDSLIKAKLTELFMTGESAIEQSALDELIANKKVTVAELDVLVVTPFNKLTKELALLQYKVLKDFRKAQNVGAEINDITKATKILKEQPITQEEIADKMQVFEKLINTKSEVIGGIDIMRLPHIASAYNALSRLNEIVNNTFYKHRVEMQELAKDIAGQIGIRLDYSDNKNLRMIRDEISKLVLSSIEYDVIEVSGTIVTNEEYHNFDTSKEEPFSYKNYKEEDKQAVDTDAFNQRFIEEVEELQKKYPDNKFLGGLSVDTEFGTGMKRLLFIDANNLEPHEIIDIQDDFRKLMVDGRYTKTQRDFVKYAVLNYGLNFGMTNYTLLLPIDIYTEVSAAMDRLFEFMLNKRDKETTTNRLKNLSQFVAIQMGVNELESLTQAKDFITAGKSSPEYGSEETPTGWVHYDMKFPVRKQGIVADQVATEASEEQTDTEQASSTEGVKSAEIKLKKGQKLVLPLMIKHYDKAYIRLAQHDGDNYIYYREISRKKYSKYYRSSQKRLSELMIFGYNVNSIFKRDAIVRSVPKSNVKVYTPSKNINPDSKLLERGVKITLKAYDDIAQVDAIEYEISNVVLIGEDGKPTEDRAKANKVEYHLINPENSLILDDSTLSDEDKKDLNNFC